MSADRTDKRRAQLEEPTSIAFPRRRLGHVEHDERGNARMEWAPLPDSAAVDDRVVFELLDQPGAGALKSAAPRTAGGGFMPYGGVAAAVEREPVPPRKPKDLRKLGEWLKMTRELEARRKRGETGD